MASKPSDYYVGAIEFFAVLLPGAAATYVLDQKEVPSDYLGITPTGTAGWIAFSLGSYLIGHLIFLLASRLDTPYDWWRKRRHPPNSDGLFAAADALRKEILKGVESADFSTFKWTKAYLQIHWPVARAEVDAYEASSKFFRSLALLFWISALYYAIPGERRSAGTSLWTFLVLACLGFLSFLRFADQRWKSTETAYAYFLLTARPENDPGSDRKRDHV